MDKIIDLLKGGFYELKWWNESRAQKNTFDFYDTCMFVLFLTTNYILKTFFRNGICIPNIGGPSQAYVSILDVR